MCIIYVCQRAAEWQQGWGENMTQNTFWIWQRNKEQIVRWKNRERMSGWLQTMPHFWRAFGWCSNPVNAGIGPARGTSQIYTIHWLLWWKSTNVTPLQILPPSLPPCKDNKSTFRKSKPLSGRPQSARRGEKNSSSATSLITKQLSLSLRHAKV